MKKKCKLAVLARDSKLAIGSKIKDRENIALLNALGITSEEAR
jgi:hypothetical protein